MSLNYYAVKEEVESFGGSIEFDDDILDAIVRLTCDTKHYTDEQLAIILKEFRIYDEIQYARYMTEKEDESEY